MTQIIVIKMPKPNFNHTCSAVILVDFVIKKDEKSYSNVL